MRSVGSRGDSYDNALAEAVNGLYKAEVIRRRGPWRSLEQVELATAEWVSVGLSARRCRASASRAAWPDRSSCKQRPSLSCPLTRLARAHFCA